MAHVALEHLDKRYPNGYVAARDLCLEIADGELLVLVGPSGSGKSTVLRMIAGLEAPTGGRILFDGDDVTGVPPQRRDVAMVFQSYALYPHMTVRENLAFGLRMRGRPAREIAGRVAKAAESLGLATLLDRRPAQLSGGQRQRVALGRAVVREPRVFLLDEPLSNLDAGLRAETRAELARLHRRLGATMVYVTHDQVEAMTLGDRVAVLDAGVLQQVGPPMTLYREPANRFVAGFIGSPTMNFLDGRLRPGADGACAFTGAGLVVPVCAPAGGVPDDGGVVLGVRPHDVVLDGEGATLHAPVTLVERLGSEQIVHLALPEGGELVAVVGGSAAVEVDDVAPVRIPPEAAHLFRADDGSRVSCLASRHRAG